MALTPAETTIGTMQPVSLIPGQLAPRLEEDGLLMMQNGAVVTASADAFSAAVVANAGLAAGQAVETALAGEGAARAETLTELRARGSAGLLDGASVEVLARSAPGDLGGGRFLWRAAELAADDNAMVIRPADVAEASPGRWTREMPLQAVWVEWFGAVAGSSLTAVATANVAAFQAAYDWCVTHAEGEGVVLLRNAEYWLNNEINMHAGTGITWRGAEGSATLRVTAFGASKALFRGRDAGNGSVTFEKLVVQTATSTAQQSHPIVFYLPKMSGGGWNDVLVRTMGNTAIWTTAPFNVRIPLGLQIMACGYQPLEKTVASATRVALTAGSNLITASADLFTADDVGRTVYLGAGGPWAPLTQPIATTITGFVDARRVNVANAPVGTEAACGISFDAPTGSIAAGSTALTLSAPVFTASDVGRLVYVERAGGSGHILVARITAVAGTAITLDTAAGTAATAERVHLTPQLYLGYPGSGSGPNDITFKGLHIENYNGPGVIVQNGVNVRFVDSKIHGINGDNFNNQGRSQRQLTICNSSYVHFSGELDYGCDRTNGNIKVYAGRSGLFLTNFWMGRGLSGQACLDLRHMGGDSVVSWDTGLLAKDCSMDPAVVLEPTDAALRLGVMSFGVRTYRAEDAAKLRGRNWAPSFISQAVAVANNGVAIIDTPGRFGMLAVSAANGAGLFFYSLDTPGVTKLGGTADLLASSATLTGSTGAAATMSLSAAGGVLRLENRTGSTKTAHLVFQGVG